MSFQKPSEAEEEFFALENVRLRLGLKADYEHQQEEIDRFAAIAKAVGSEDICVGEALADLGFEADTAGILPLIPLVEVAWSNGKMGFDEARLILDTARGRGMSATTAAYKKLSELTDAQPNDTFFAACNKVFAELLAKMGHGADVTKHNTLTLMTKVAEAQGGFFGLTSAIDGDEQAEIDRLVKELGLGD